MFSASCSFSFDALIEAQNLAVFEAQGICGWVVMPGRPYEHLLDESRMVHRSWFFCGESTNFLVPLAGREKHGRFATHASLKQAQISTKPADV
jgi:hypothetical protein